MVLTVYILLVTPDSRKRRQADPFPEDVGDILSTAHVEVLTAVVWNRVLMQGGEPVMVACYSTAVPLVHRRTFGYTVLVHKQPFPSVLTLFTCPCTVFQASLRPALLSVLYNIKPSFRSCLAFSLTWRKILNKISMKS